MALSDPKAAGFTWKQTTELAGYWSLHPGDWSDQPVEVCLEPTVFGDWLLAVYVHDQLAHEEKLDLAAIEAGGPLLQF